MQDHIAALEQDSKKSINEVTLLKSHIDEQKVEACEQIDKSREVVGELNQAKMHLSRANSYCKQLEGQIQASEKNIEALMTESKVDKVR